MTDTPTDTDTEGPPDPENPRCPKCGTPATDESVLSRSLSDLGYMHKDVRYQCAADGCSESWVHGIPDGSAPEFADELECGVCGGWFLVHRVEAQSGGVLLHLKCPECYHFKQIRRDYDDANRALVGYPQITGDLNPDKPYGYDPDELPLIGDGGDRRFAVNPAEDAEPECGEPLCIQHGHGTLGCPLNQSGDGGGDGDA